ncbi:hypothetical protein [Sphingosinithalassobacter portus]|uniref:COG4705 family protein n=1 Tax=Stakelama portus TaxID=2676234 RepID=UPI000D6E63C9|nr:hypothetical protein [Sphingosinithalassobacter portus]
MLTKVPAVTLGFWIIKILATTFGETAGDTVSMSLNLGYLIGTAIFATALVVLVVAQIRAPRFHPALYWATIIASTTAGTTMADFATRSIGIGYPGGSALLLACLLASLFLWYRMLGSISIQSLHRADAEIYYWITITFSQTLGTALGDWVADGPLGYSGAALIFGGAIALLGIAYFTTRIDRVALFWLAFVLTRPLGAAVGDFLDKPIANGGLELSRAAASAVLAGAIILLIWLVPQRAERGHAPTSMN